MAIVPPDGLDSGVQIVGVQQHQGAAAHPALAGGVEAADLTRTVGRHDACVTGGVRQSKAAVEKALTAGRSSAVNAR